MTLHWKGEPDDHDYPAATSYLSLVFTEEAAKAIVFALREAPLVDFHAKDIFRASGLPMLDTTNHHVKKTLRKIQDGEELSPILLVRSSRENYVIAGLVIIADGYHRLCGVYTYDEDALIPCKIV